jgi:branched-chain amino acid transport system substrate-binding protein
MNKTTKIIGGIIVLAIIVLIVVFYKPAPKETIKIGAILPLSGTNAYIGQDMREGIDMAVEEINKKSGVNRKLIEIIYEDSAGDPKIAISSFNKLYGLEDVKLFITTLSNVTLALAPLAEENETPMFTIACSPSILDAGEYTFVNNFNGEQELGFLANFIISKFQFKKLGIIAQNTEFAIQYKDVLERRWKERGGDMVANELFDNSATDYRTQLLKIKNANPDFIYVVGYSPHITRVLIQARELGIQKQFFSYWGAQEKKLLEDAGDTAEGLIISSSPFSKETAAEFFEKYEPKYNREPHYKAGLSYDIVGMLVKALKKCDVDSSKTICIKDEIYKIIDYPGVTGSTSVTDKGDTTKEIIIWEVKNGQFVPYESD